METNPASVVADQGVKVVLNTWPWGVLTAAAAFLCTMAVQRMAGGIALHPLRDATPGHWTEKARLAYPGWVTLGVGQILQAGFWSAVVAAYRDNCGFGVIPLVTLAAFAGAGVVSVRMESRVRERTVSMLDWMRSWAVVFLFYLAPFAVFCLLFQLPDQFNWAVLWAVLAAMGVVLGLNFGGTLALARWIGLLRPAPERLQAIVDLAVQRMGVERPVVYVLLWKVANALAFPFGRVVAVTDLALKSLTDEELVAVCSHELAHLTEPRLIHLARLAGQFAWLPLFLIEPLRGTLGLGRGLLAALGACLIAHVLVRRMIFACEKRADSAGKAHEGEAGTYARALEKLYEINLTPAVARARLPTHPHLYDRLLAAGITPPYARPNPPSRWRGKVALVFVVLAGVLCAILWMIFVSAAQGWLSAGS